MIQKRITYSLFAAAVLIIDRITKYYAVKLCAQTCVVNDVLSFYLVYNRGVSWGMLQSNNTMYYSLVNLVIVLVAAGLMVHAYRQWRAGYCILGEVAALTGAVSNLIDRCLYQGVIDFIALSAYGYAFPVFNVADVAIVGGVLFMLLQTAPENNG